MKAIIGEGKQDQTQQCAITFRRLVILLEIVKQIRRPRRIRKLKTKVSGGKEPKLEDLGIEFSVCVLQLYFETSHKDNRIGAFRAVFDTSTTHHVFKNWK